MNTSVLSLATLLALALPLRAQRVSGAASEAAAWVGPIASAVSAAGSERIAGLGFTSLTALSQVDATGRYPFLCAPQALGPLVTAVRAQGLEPEAFSALSTTEKLEVLSRAAAPAQAQAAQIADEALAAVAEPLSLGTADDAARKVANARAVSIYLPASRAAAVAAAAKTVVDFEQKRAELMEAYLHDLPAKLAAGAFDGDNFIGRDRDGWYAADEKPTQRHETLAALYAARLQSAAQKPAGPWTVAEYALLHQALENPRNAAALDEPWTEGRDWWTGSMLPSSRLKREISLRQSDAAGWASRLPGLAAAVARFGAGAPRAADFAAVDKFYLSALNNRFRFDWTAHARIVAAVRTGDAALPSWARIQELRREAKSRYQKNAFTGMFAFCGALIAAGLVGASHWPPAFKFVAFAAMLAPMAWMFVNIWRRDVFPFDEDAIEIQLRDR